MPGRWAHTVTLAGGSLGSGQVPEGPGLGGSSEPSTCGTSPGQIRQLKTCHWQRGAFKLGAPRVPVARRSRRRVGACRRAGGLRLTIARARRAADISSWPRGPGPRATRRHPGRSAGQSRQLGTCHCGSGGLSMPGGGQGAIRQASPPGGRVGACQWAGGSESRLKPVIGLDGARRSAEP